MYIYNNNTWPDFTWDNRKIIMPLSMVRNLQGKLVGRMEAMGFSLRNEATLETLVLDIVKSSEIEGENIDSKQVRSSIARRLGMNAAGLVPIDHYIDGVVDMMMDATQNYEQLLTKERLFTWHAALFSTGRSGMNIITVADWRKDEKGPMQVVSDPIGKEKVHFQAPSSDLVSKEMNLFLKWFNDDKKMEPVLKSGLAHLWFLTVHPFDDGNGRIARAIADMQLARADMTNQRFYSMSAYIERHKNAYYNMLEKTQKGPMDITSWLFWYIESLTGALESTEETLEKVLIKAKFWKKHAATIINMRQKQIINILLDDFFGKLSTSKWAKMAKCSQDTALRDIQDLIGKGILIKEPGGGRSTNYVINISIGKVL